MNATTEHNLPQRQSNGQSARKLWSVALFCAGFAIFIWWQWPKSESQVSTATIPEAALEGVHPRVAALITDSRAAVVRRPQSSQAWGLYGMVLRAHEYNAEAVAAFEQAESLDTNEFRWPYFRGDALEHVDAGAAEKAFFEAYKRNSAEPLSLIRIARLRLRNGQAKQAMASLTPAFDEKEPDVRIVELLARCHLMIGNFQKCLEFSRLAIRIKPNRVSALRLHVQIATRLKRTEEAATSSRSIEQAAGEDQRDVDPYRAEISQLRRDPRWYAFQAQELLKSGKAQEAVTLLQESIAAYPQEGILTVILARTYVEREAKANADLVLKDGLTRFPNSTPLLQVRALQALLREQWKDAIRDLRLVLKRDPSNSSARADLGFCLRQAGQVSEAERELKAALQSRPDLTEARLQLAEMLLSQSKTALAKQHIRHVLIQKPDHVKAKQLLDRTLNSSRE